MLLLDIFVACLLCAAAWWALWDSGSGGQPRPERVAGVSPAAVPVTASPSPALVKVGPAPHLAIRRHSALAVQIRALKRLAAQGLPLYCGGTRRRMVALTFDDGPGVYTHYAIEKLRQAHLRATFFLVGKELQAWPGLAQREEPVAAFGDHTMTHPFLPGIPYREAVREIVAARRLIERTVHEPVLLFRPPYEGRTAAIDAEVRRLRMVEVLWNVDSADSLGANYRGIERNVIHGLRPGSIILMHENHGQTIRALRAIFAALRRRHLHAVTVPQLIEHDPPTPAQLREGYAGCPLEVSHGSGS